MSQIFVIPTRRKAQVSSPGVNPFAATWRRLGVIQRWRKSAKGELSTKQTVWRVVPRKREPKQPRKQPKLRSPYEETCIQYTRSISSEGNDGGLIEEARGCQVVLIEYVT